MTKIYRLLRVLEYVGSREWIDDAITRRGVKGTMLIPTGKFAGAQIREAIIGETSELIKDAQEDEQPES